MLGKRSPRRFVDFFLQPERLRTPCSFTSRFTLFLLFALSSCLYSFSANSPSFFLCVALAAFCPRAIPTTKPHYTPHFIPAQTCARSPASHSCSRSQSPWQPSPLSRRMLTMPSSEGGIIEKECPTRPASRNEASTMPASRTLWTVLGRAGRRTLPVTL